MLKKMLENRRAAKIQKRGLKWRTGFLEHRNESLAREFYVRRVILKKLKKFFGKEMKALLLFGSVQNGIRKSVSTKTNPNSDIDLVLILTEKAWGQIVSKGFLGLDNTPHYIFIEKIEQEAQKRIGTTLHLFPVAENHLTEKYRKPFQIIYGQEFIETKIPAKELQQIPATRKKELEENNKYKNRP
jgi:predicted nucleotidyltransferase